MSSFYIAFAIFIVSLIGFLLGVFPSKIKLSQTKEDFIFILSGSIFLGYTTSYFTDILHKLEESKDFFFNLLLIFIGILTMKILNHSLFKKQVCCSNGFLPTEWGLLSLASICLCSLNDGFFLFFSIDTLDTLFPALILWILIHKFTISFLIARVIYTCKIHQNLQRTMGILILITTPLIYLLANPITTFFIDTESDILTLLISFSLGILLYVTLSGILPRIPRYYKQRKLQLIIGFLILSITFISGITH